MSKEIIIKTDNIIKNYEELEVLKDINFQVHQGDFCALLGENGAGKSTLLKIIMGHEIASSGEVSIMGKNIKTDGHILRKDIGFVTETINYDVPFSVKTFINTYSKFFEKWDDQKFNKLMIERNLNVNKQFAEFSRGQKMQVVLIAALAMNPKILLIDEITSVLDIYARKYFIEILEDFTKNGGTVLITTNIISEIHFASNKIAIIDEGVIKVNEDINQIPQKFIKIRKIPGNEHPIFEHPQCFWSGHNSDDSHSFIIPASVASEFQYENNILDKRAITLDEIFIYYIKSRS